MAKGVEVAAVLKSLGQDEVELICNFIPVVVENGRVYYRYLNYRLDLETYTLYLSGKELPDEKIRQTVVDRFERESENWLTEEIRLLEQIGQMYKKLTGAENQEC